MTKQQFVATAKPLVVNIGGVPVQATARKFSTGSVGWYACGKAPVQLPDGTVAKIQIGGNLTVCGSKDWEEGTEAAAA